MSAAPLLAIKVALVLTGIAIMARATRLQPARVRAGLWCAGIAAALTMPLMMHVLPPLGVSLPSWATARTIPSPTYRGPAPTSAREMRIGTGFADSDAVAARQPSSTDENHLTRWRPSPAADSEAGAAGV